MRANLRTWEVEKMILSEQPWQCRSCRLYFVLWGTSRTTITRLVSRMLSLDWPRSCFLNTNKAPLHLWYVFFVEHSRLWKLTHLIFLSFRFAGFLMIQASSACLASFKSFYKNRNTLSTTYVLLEGYLFIISHSESGLVFSSRMIIVYTLLAGFLFWKNLQCTRRRVDASNRVNAFEGTWLGNLSFRP